MSDYNDIARRNPQGATSVISSFGYEIVDRSDLGQSLNELVANEGEPALIKVMEIHPDKDLILELFGEKNQNKIFETSKSQCGCGSCARNSNGRQEQFMNASGSDANSVANTSKQNSQSDVIASQTNVILVVATIFVTVALLMHKKI